MEEWRKEARRDAVIVDIDALVPKDHLLRKIEKVMDYDCSVTIDVILFLDRNL